jgi:hypothetical protein
MLEIIRMVMIHLLLEQELIIYTREDAFKVRANTHEVIVRTTRELPSGRYEYTPGTKNGAGLYFGEPDSIGSTRVVSSNIQNSNVPWYSHSICNNGTFYQSTIIIRWQHLSLT